MIDPRSERPARLFALGVWCSALGLLGCQYDLDPLYEHAERDAGGVADAEVLASAQLIGSWIGKSPTVDRDCITCAEERCAVAESDCRADPTCVAYTDCVGKNPTPGGQAACRAQFASWVGQGSVRDRDLSGPYGQCVFRYNCSAECESSTDLSCVGAYTWPLTAETTVPLHLYLVDAYEQTVPLPMMRVRACNAADIRCTEPLSDTITDDKGLAELRLPASFSRAFTGYLEVTGKDVYPTLLKFSWNLASETTQLVGIVKEANFRLAINAIDLRPDPARGMLQLRMLSCGHVGVAGVSFAAERADAQTRNWYIINGFPTLSATATDSVGSGGIIDVPEGSTTVNATRASDGVAVARAIVPVRANFMSVVVFSPLASQ
jgi:hypothetical protein